MSELQRLTDHMLGDPSFFILLIISLLLLVSKRPGTKLALAGLLLLELSYLLVLILKPVLIPLQWSVGMDLGELLPFTSSLFSAAGVMLLVMGYRRLD